MVRGKPDYKGPPLELQCVNTIRAMSADQPQAANAGHPGEKAALSSSMGFVCLLILWHLLCLQLSHCIIFDTFFTNTFPP
jgi:hypothetical protein